MERKSGGLGIRPQDFMGPCQPCLTDCLTEIEKTIKKFCEGFVVRDRFTGLGVNASGGNMAANAFRQSFVTRLQDDGGFFGGGESIEYPSGATSGGLMTTGAFIPVVVERCTVIGDIRIGYSDHYTPAGTRTFMKRPEEWWARYYLELDGELEDEPEDDPPEDAPEDDPPEGAAASPPPAEEPSDEPEEPEVPVEPEEPVEPDEPEDDPEDDPEGDPEDEPEDTPASRNAKKIADWIRCRHLNTDHKHELSLGGSTYKETIDDCVEGIWDFNLVDTFTTIEKIDIYGKVDYFSTFPICGGLKITDSNKMHEYHWDAAGHVRQLRQGEVWEDEVGSGQAWLIALAAEECDDVSIAERSESPHLYGTNREQPLPNRSRRFDNADQRKDIGLMRETYVKKVGTIYATTVHGSPDPAPFQVPLTEEQAAGHFLPPRAGYWTIMEPHSEGTYTSPDCGDYNKLWCNGTRGKDSDGNWGPLSSPRLLQFPCFNIQCDPSSDTGWSCDTFNFEYCQEQLDNIYDYYNSAYLALLGENEPRILTKGGAAKIDAEAIHCYQSEFLSYVHNESTGSTGSYDSPGTGSSVSYNGFTSGNRPELCPFTRCENCGEALSCRQASLEVGDLKSQMELFADGRALRNCFTGDWVLPTYCECAEGTNHPFNDEPIKYEQSPKGGSHCGGDSESTLAAVTFYVAPLCKLDGTDASVETEYKLDFEEVYQKTFPNDRGVIPAGFGLGGVHADIKDAIKAWTCVKNGPDGVEYTTDYEAANVFYRRDLEDEKYWYDIKKEVGESRPFPAHLSLSERATGRFNNDRVCFKEPPCVDPPNDCCPGADFVPHSHERINDETCGFEDQIQPCGEESIKARIFTGAGHPPARYDIEQRVHVFEADPADPDCGEEGKPRCCAGLIDVDDLFRPTEDYLKDCYPDFDENDTLVLSSSPPAGVNADIPLEVICAVDEEGIIFDPLQPQPTGRRIAKLKLCLKDGYIYTAHRPQLEVYIPETGFFSCGEPIGKVDRAVIGEYPDGPEEQDLCKAEWPCETCCGLVPDQLFSGGLDPLYHQVGCSHCEDYECGPWHDYWCNETDLILPHCTKGPLCCPDKWPNTACIDPDTGQIDPFLCGFNDPEGNYVYNGPMFHNNIPSTTCEDPFWCYLDISWMAGTKHSPWENGYLWQTYYGWYTSFTDLMQIENPYGCHSYDTSGGISPTFLSRCCSKILDGQEIGISNVPCELYIISKEESEQEITIDVGELPVTITLE